jgi:transposase-like protein
MTMNTDTAMPALLLGEADSDPIEDRLRETVRATIEALFDEELAAYLGRIRYGGGGGARKGYRHGRRERELVGTFGTETVSVPRARIEGEDGKTTEWRSRALPRYQRLTRRAEALIAAVYLAGTNTRRVKRALFGLFQGAVGKGEPLCAMGSSTMANVSRAWRTVTVDRDAWCARSLADEGIVRLILDGTAIRTRLDKKATNISVLAAIGVRRDGQKILLSIRHMGGESTAAWRQFLDDLDARGPRRPDFVIVDGAPGLEAALTALWGAELPIQRCTVHKHRNLLGHAPEHLHDELTEDCRDMIYAATAAKVETRRKAFLRKWRLKCIRHCRSDQWRANGSSSPTVSKTPASGCSPSPASIRRNGSRPGQPTPSSASTRNSADASRPRPCRLAPRPCPCCSGPCSPPGKSACARSTAGRPSPSPSSPSPLTKPPDQAEITMLGERRSRISTNSQTRPRRGMVPSPRHQGHPGHVHRAKRRPFQGLRVARA